MTQFEISTNDLEALSDLAWFDTMCGLLTKERNPTTKKLTSLIGTEDIEISRGNRGSKFLVPFDKRFKTACINPDLSDDEADKPLEYLGVGGVNFTLKMADILKRFPDYKIKRNIYDGGSQLFFNPVDDKFEFSALSFDLDKDPEELRDIQSLKVHQVIFNFGEHILIGRDGYHTKR